MMKPIWGLQALIASHTQPMDEDDFSTMLGLVGKIETSPIRKVVQVLVACYRLANHLGIDVEAEVREYLKDQRR